MRRSRRPQCSVGRGCACCGDESAFRRLRLRTWDRADRRPSALLADIKSTGHPRHHDEFYEGKHHKMYERHKRHGKW
jgi:putative heme iron utilization protein